LLLLGVLNSVRYGIENWGAGYFGVNRKGNLIVRASENDANSADMKEIIDDLRRRGINTPVLIRFPQLLVAQIRKLQSAFRKSIKEFEYEGDHMCVFPMKVNQNRAVIEEYLKEGKRYNFGLEAGSKAELYGALAMEQSEESLLVLNGFKDHEFIRLAFLGARSGKNVVIVIEKLSELETTLSVMQEITKTNPEAKLPMLGVRVKLYSKGSGKWEKSGGEAAKFGLTTTELLEVIRRLAEVGRTDLLQLLHFHIGSQLTDIKRIKNAMKEAARTYAKIRQTHTPKSARWELVSSFWMSAAEWRWIMTALVPRSSPPRITMPGNSRTMSSMSSRTSATTRTSHIRPSFRNPGDTFPPITRY